MPDKSKRRRNNKNKRKNKKLQSSTNSNNEQVTLENKATKVNDSLEDNKEVISQQRDGDFTTKVNLLNNDNNPDNINSVCSKTEKKIIINKDNNIKNKSVTTEEYVVELPEQTLDCKCKIRTISKSKSLDNSDPRIVDITEIELSTHQNDTDNSIIVSNNETLIQYDKTTNLQEDKLKTEKKESITKSLLTNDQSSMDNQSFTPEDEKSLRNYLKTLDVTNLIEKDEYVNIKTDTKPTLRKSILNEDLFVQRNIPHRILDVIDEEGSSDSSISSRRHSYLGDTKNDQDTKIDCLKDLNENVRKCSYKKNNNCTTTHLITQECKLVDTKLREPDVSEARGDWIMQTLENKITGAEVVYLTDSSSSTSSKHDLSEVSDDGIDDDVSIRMITPTIEVIDTENLLKKSFTYPNNVDKDNYHENNIENDMNDISLHDIVVLSTDNIVTNLYVKDVDETANNVQETIIRSVDKNIQNANQAFVSNNQEAENQCNSNFEIEELKCELNNAMNNLIKEVSSDSENNNDGPKETFTRHDSSSSIGSSQSTAKYNPTYSSLNDVSNIMHDVSCANNNPELVETNCTSRHVKDVFESVTGISSENKEQIYLDYKQPLSLRDISVKKILSLPYGNKILEELASVSQRLQNIYLINSDSDFPTNPKRPEYKHSEGSFINADKMPYFPLPDLSCIEKVSIPGHRHYSHPPPVQPRNSSLKKSFDDHWTAVPTQTEPVYVCLSPSQKMLMQKTNTVLSKEDASHLVSMHKKFIDRRGYNESYNKEKIDKERIDPPIVPFKSQTGSRLLALICDPTLTKNIDTTSKKFIASNSKSETTLNKHCIQSRNNLNAFRPIPPPRPRKYSSSFYESDESSDFTDNSLGSFRSEKKYFHFSTGNLNKEIEDDISSIQHLHKFYTRTRDSLSNDCPRRPSLPQEMCDNQLEYIRRKEKEVEAEISRLEEKKINMTVFPKVVPRAPLFTPKVNLNETKTKLAQNNTVLCKDKGERKSTSNFSKSQEEIHRDKMYSEYISKIAERQERKDHKIIKIKNIPNSLNTVSKSMSTLEITDSKVNNKIEEEFISKARERWDKLGIKDPETEDEGDKKDVYTEPKIIEHKINVIDGGEIKDVQNLPGHLQDFVRFAAKDKQASEGTGESDVEPASPHVVLVCTVIILMLAFTRLILRLLRLK